MSKLFILVFIFGCNYATAQTLKISEKKIFEAFKKTILKDKDGRITTGRSAWYSCNDDSAYFKSDTISLYYNPTGNTSFDCCSSVSWTFYEKNKFLETRYQRCKEPPSGSAAKENDIYQIKIITVLDSVFLKFSNKNGKMYTFKIVEIIESNVENSNKLSYELFLYRQK